MLGVLGKKMESEIREQPGVLAANCQRYGHELSHCLRGKQFDLVLIAAGAPQTTPPSTPGI